MSLTFRVDPRPTSYESSIQVDEDDTPDAAVDPFVETRAWAPVKPERRSLPESVAFVDGVQRVETRLIGEQNGRVVYGALASVSVGVAFHAKGRARTESGAADRVLALSDGGGGDDVTEPEVECGPMVLRFRVRNSAASGFAGVHDALTSARREAETRLGGQLIEAGHPLVIVDGRLNFDSSRSSLAVGLIKTMQKQYLEGEHLAVLSQLDTGARSPLFRIARDRSVYSWYIRLATSRAIDHPWAGLARLETLDSTSLRETVQLADVTAQHLPAFASHAMWDARAPQNLYPIAALEAILHHELGDHEWIRRHIDTHFHRHGAAA